MKARWFKKKFQFKQPSGTSRGVLHDKTSYFILINDNQKIGIGECGLLPGLSVDNLAAYEQCLNMICANIKQVQTSQLTNFPSIRFGIEMARISLNHIDPFCIYDTPFFRGTKKLDINGLIWMGDFDFMAQQIEEKINKGFRCIKLKIGAINFEDELTLIKKIRKQYGVEDIEIRVDANGAFTPDEALSKLNQLAACKLHSIEQPIAAGQWEQMAVLCEQTPLAIALDEELIGIHHQELRNQMLSTIKPQFLIFKPSLIGGFEMTEAWIQLCKKHHIGWWLTSALESNIGLNAIAQFCDKWQVSIPQGLGTGQLYTNNIASPLFIHDGQIGYNSDQNWDWSWIAQ